MRKVRFGNKHFVVLFGNGITSVIGFAMAYIIFHNLPIVEAGIWFILQSFVGLCEAGRYGFLATATVKFYAGTDKARSETVLGSVWFLAIMLTAIVLALNGLALLYLPYTTNFEAILCIKWIGLNYLSSLPSDVVFWRLQADEKYATMFWFRMINACSTILSFILLAIFHDFTLENVIIYNFITNCTSSLIGIFWFHSGIQYFTKRSKECILEIFHYGKYTFGTTAFSSFLGNVDIWIMNFILGPASVAIYNLANRLMALVELPLRTFATTGISEMAIANNAGNEHQVGYIFRKYTGMLTVALIPVAIIAFLIADVAISLLGGHHFDGASGDLAAHVYRLFMILAITYPFDRFTGMALDITHHTKTNFYKMIIVTSVKIVTGLLFTELLKSLYGIVISNFIATIIGIIYGSYQLNKHIPHNIPGILRIGYTELILLVKKAMDFKKSSATT